jgi:hypothetical protein
LGDESNKVFGRRSVHTLVVVVADRSGIAFVTFFDNRLVILQLLGTPVIHFTIIIVFVMHILRDKI